MDVKKINTNCECGHNFDASFTLAEIKAGGRNYVCKNCRHIGWIYEKTGKAEIVGKPNPMFLRELIKT